MQGLTRHSKQSSDNDVVSSLLTPTESLLASMSNWWGIHQCEASAKSKRPFTIKPTRQSCTTFAPLVPYKRAATEVNTSGNKAYVLSVVNDIPTSQIGVTEPPPIVSSPANPKSPQMTRSVPSRGRAGTKDARVRDYVGQFVRLSGCQVSSVRHIHSRNATCHCISYQNTIR